MDKEEDVLTSSLLQLFLPAPALQSVALRGRLASRIKEMLLVAFSLSPLTFFDTVEKNIHFKQMKTPALAIRFSNSKVARGAEGGVAAAQALLCRGGNVMERSQDVATWEK